MKYIKLPNGKLVQRLEQGEEMPPLHICPECGSDFVHPLMNTIEECEDHPDHWRLTNHCGECGTFIAVVAPDEDCQKFDEWLDERMAEIEHQHHLMAQANMADWVDLFLVALNANTILPFDF